MGKTSFPKDEGVLVVLCGPPGSGKTTLRNMLVDEYGFSCVCPDDIRKELLGDETCQEEGELIFSTAYSRLRYELAFGNVVFDATNCQPSYRKRILSETDGCRILAIAIVLPTPLEDCLRNNRNRWRQVPEHVIRRMHGTLEGFPPCKDEGFDAVIEYRSPSREAVRDIFSFSNEA